MVKVINQGMGDNMPVFLLIFGRIGRPTLKHLN
jgi:hypothetical protein